MDDILRSTPPEVEQVIIEPNGKWSSPKDEESARMGGAPTSPDEDGDLIEIKEPGIPSLKQEPLPAHIALQRTPVQSCEPSTTSSTGRQSTNKRPAAQVIDLTGSDDEDTPSRPAKRPFFNPPAQPCSEQGFSNSFSVNSLNCTGLNPSSQNSSESPSQATFYYDT